MLALAPRFDAELSAPRRGAVAVVGASLWPVLVVGLLEVGSMKVYRKTHHRQEIPEFYRNTETRVVRETPVVRESRFEATPYFPVAKTLDKAFDTTDYRQVAVSL